MNLIQADIRQHWDRIKEGILFIKDETFEAERPEDIYSGCVNGQATLWITESIPSKDAFLITQARRNQFTGENYLLLWVAWYTRESGADQFQEQIEQLAKNLECSYIEFWTSKKEIRDHGFAHGYDQITYKCKKEL